MSFTTDWFSKRTAVWREHLSGLRGQAAHALEIGCWEGRASLWMLENLLTHPASTLTVIDTFEGSPEHLASVAGLEERFDQNIAAHRARVTKHRGLSGEVLRTLPQRNHFHLIYIDGSHQAVDVLTDAVLAFPLLVPGGFLVFDDYKWKTHLPAPQRPQLAIDAFLSVFREEVQMLHHGYQVFISKISPKPVLAPPRLAGGQ